MKNYLIRNTLLKSSLFLSLGVSPLSAAVMSIDINASSGSTTASGEPVNTAGLALAGQIGFWDTIAIPVFSATSTNPFSVDTGSGVFTFNTNSGTISGFKSDGTSDLRSDMVFLTSGTADWTLTGLVDGASYNIILFGSSSDDGLGDTNSPANPAAFSIAGHNGGAVVGLDAENDGDFTNVVATGGTISGTMAHTTGFSALSGIQFEQVPEPSSTLLLGLAGIGLCLRRRK